MEIDAWAYQLQNINIPEIAGNSTFQLVVIDYSSDGLDEHKFTSEQVQQIKFSGKKAISYISVVATLVNEVKAHGYYEVKFSAGSGGDGSNL